MVCLLAPTAAFASARDVIRDCTNNGKIDSFHSQGDYRGALSGLPADIDQYTDCAAIIKAAQRRDATSDPAGGPGGTSGGTGGFGSFDAGFGGSFDDLGAAAPPSAAEQSALDAAAATAAPVTVQGEPIVPGAAGLGSESLRNSVPTPLLVMLILVGTGALLVAVGRLRGRRGSAGGGLSAPPQILRLVDRVFPRRA
ncbi:MAG: hypothetical protein ACR2NH_10560 [Solirubrobacteraceae bacterium]